MKIYCGIGSRVSPPNILAKMEAIGKLLGEAGWLLRSGGASGADEHFEKGADSVYGAKEIYLPWRGFNGGNSSLHNPSKEAQTLAATIHPAWHNCSSGARKLHARNCHQVLGKGLDLPVDVVICWTKDGAVVGGTSTAIRLAIKFNIPIINLATNDITPEEILNTY